MDEEKVSAPVAADKAMRQVGGALVAIVLVLCSVFVPVAFLGGITGTMLRQFAVTLVVAVVLSGMVALTLTPALCALLLKETPARHHTTGSSGSSTASSTGPPTGYAGNVGRILAPAARPDWPRSPCCWCWPFVLYRRVPSAFIPTEDKGFFVVAIQLPDGASRQRTDKVVEQVEGILRKEPGVRQFTGAGRVQPPGRGQPVERRDDVRAAQGVGASAARTRRSTRSWAGSTASCSGCGTRWPSASTSRRSRVSARPPVSSSTSRRAAARTCPPSRGRSRPCWRTCRSCPRPGRGHHLPRRGAAGLRARGPGDCQGARRQAGRPLRRPAGDALVALHQRLQPVRPDLPGAGRGAAPLPADARGHRPALRAGRGRAQQGHDPAQRADPGRVPRRAQRAEPVQRIQLGAGDRRRATPG